MSDINDQMIDECPTDGVIFDIGANRGCYTVRMAKRVKEVYAFEPEPKNIEELKKAIADHTNVKVHEVALSDRTGITKLMLHPGNHGGHSIHETLDGKQWKHTLENAIDVDMITLDLWCQHNGITRVDGIKIDVEAHEQQVLEGAKETLKKYHPLISLETHQTADMESIQVFLQECGYEVPELVVDKAYLLRKKSA